VATALSCSMPSGFSPMAFASPPYAGAKRRRGDLLSAAAGTLTVEVDGSESDRTEPSGSTKRRCSDADACSGQHGSDGPSLAVSGPPLGGTPGSNTGVSRGSAAGTTARVPGSCASTLTAGSNDPSPVSSSSGTVQSDSTSPLSHVTPDRHAVREPSPSSLPPLKKDSSFATPLDGRGPSPILFPFAQAAQQQRGAVGFSSFGGSPGNNATAR
jgi:hypothetical protein